jgi:hypothetical protein
MMWSMKYGRVDQSAHALQQGVLIAKAGRACGKLFDVVHSPQGLDGLCRASWEYIDATGRMDVQIRQRVTWAAACTWAFCGICSGKGPMAARLGG